MSEVAVLLDGAAVPAGKILCVGRNYSAHAAEMGEKPAGDPILFLKPTTALVRPDGGEVRVPRSFGLLHHEIELAVLLGRGGRNMSPDEAEAAISGYGIALDLTLREMQGEAKAAGRPWTLAKGFDGSCPAGDFAPVATIPKPHEISFELEVNGEVRQRGVAKSMLFAPGEILAYASRYMTLEPGDILLAGTPEGVGPLEDGDRVTGRADGLPELRFTLSR